MCPEGAGVRGREMETPTASSSGPHHSPLGDMKGDNTVIDEITPKRIGDWPNTYTYTKALGEMVVQQESRSPTIAIRRPSIVGATCHKPFPGWVRTLNGPSRLIIAVCSGMKK
ncbi:hypothetical protein H8957_006883 [Semnopithecus entellus]